ncbi:MAG: M1 family metallopeptidase [Flavobacteriales bacterium]|jgi:hypothetical protein|nr:M1 family metallopeptidase [Flavobacteriales bacterium]
MRLFRSWLPLLAAAPTVLAAQCTTWQQQVAYSMAVDLDVRTHRFTGETTLGYTNNSPDTLREVFFHMYLNAFRPGSEMDVRSRTIADPDRRVGDRIAELAPEEMGELRITGMTQHRAELDLEPMGTVLRATLARPLLPGRSTELAFGFTGQVPLQIRRTGRQSAEGVAYSMTQWYPKIAAYDQRGWHAYPYVGREFHGVWGDFDVRITLDSAYTVAATGVLGNPEQVGHGYPTAKRVKRPAGDKLTWRFTAQRVHDFAWAADPDYLHTVHQVPGGPLFHFFRKDDPELAATWDQLPGYMEQALAIMNAEHGAYPWPQYSFVQGGDGGMEYPMLTLITGKRRLGSLVGVSVHEFVHSWYQGLLASNEGRYAWMDEGMTEYASSRVMARLFPSDNDPHEPALRGYLALVGTDDHEPASVHADHFITNRAYGTTAYSFGEVLVHQLGAVIGGQHLAAGIRRFADACRFKHPDPVDMERAFEKQSGLELDWYYDQWLNTTRQLDYAINSVLGSGDGVHIVLERKEEMLMPVDVRVHLRDGRVEDHHVPLSLARGAKGPETDDGPYTVWAAWQWTDPYYVMELPVPLGDIAAIVLDPLRRTADVDRSNDMVVLPEGGTGLVRP